MQPYITQLVEQLQEAQTRRPASRHLELPEEMKCLEDVIDMEMSIEEGGSSMEALFGIPKYYFPPAERLTDQQLEQLVEAILDLWGVFHYEADLPNKLPARHAYPRLLDCWQESYPVFRGTNGTWHIEFCHYDPAECPFPKEYCHCTRFDEEHNQK